MCVIIVNRAPYFSVMSCDVTQYYVIIGSKYLILNDTHSLSIIELTATTTTSTTTTTTAATTTTTTMASTTNAEAMLLYHKLGVPLPGKNSPMDADSIASGSFLSLTTIVVVLTHLPLDQYGH